MEYPRFEHLAATLGGDMNRWPEAERAGARALIERDPRAAALMAEAGALDDLLDDWRVAPASIALRDRVMGTAPALRKAWRTVEGLRLWFAGVGLAAGLAGVSCGVVLSSVAVREAQDEAVLAAAYHDPFSATSSFSEPVHAL